MAGMARENQRMVQEPGLAVTVTHSMKEMERVTGFQNKVESAKPIPQQLSPEFSPLSILMPGLVTEHIHPAFLA